MTGREPSLLEHLEFVFAACFADKPDTAAVETSRKAFDAEYKRAFGEINSFSEGSIEHLYNAAFDLAMAFASSGFSNDERVSAVAGCERRIRDIKKLIAGEDTVFVELVKMKQFALDGDCGNVQKIGRNFQSVLATNLGNQLQGAPRIQLLVNIKNGYVANCGGDLETSNNLFSELEDQRKIY